MQVLSATDSLVLLLFFVLKSLLSLLCTSRYAFLYYYLFDSSVFAKHSVIDYTVYNTACDVIYAMPRLIHFC